MKENILTRRKGGMTAMVIIIFVNLLALAMMIYGGMRLGESPITLTIFVLGVVILCVGWIPFLGLKILRPQEALVL
ncbi:MAG: SPFH domain-containing protein, partial [Clostridia bacterium]|nr:SPFH domain-containing protein [Clostridia bacterium]